MTQSGNDPHQSEELLQQARQLMVKEQIAGRGVKSPEVLEAMRIVPRHKFVPESQFLHAYADSALPLEYGQSISQPYIVGLMTELLAPRPGQKILEIGTGSGYQAAILAHLGAQVHTIEIHAALAAAARIRLEALGYATKVFIRAGDGFLGWPEFAPFDGILLACAVSQVPKPLLDQLKPKGRMVLPLGESLDYQNLTVVDKSENNRLTFRDVLGVVFVPMLGPHGFG